MSVARTISVTPLRWFLIGVLPFAVASVYLWLSRWPSRWFTELSDYTAFAVSIAAFTAAVLMLPLERKKKVLIAVCSVPFLAAALVLFSLVFVGYAFGDWL